MKRIAFTVLASLIFTSPAIADRCGKDDRVTLPSCAKGYFNGGSFNLSNRCNYRVTYKVDVEGASDFLISVQPGETERRKLDGERSYKAIRAFKCCPRYSACTQKSADARKKFWCTVFKKCD